MKRIEDPNIPTFLSDRSIAHHLSRQDVDDFLNEQIAFINEHRDILTSNGFKISDSEEVKKVFYKSADRHNKLHTQLTSVITLTDKLVNNRNNILNNILINNVATGLKNLNEKKREGENQLHISNANLPDSLKGTLEEHCGHGKD